MIITDEMVEKANRASIRVFIPSLTNEEYDAAALKDPAGHDLIRRSMRAALEAVFGEGAK